MQKRRIAFLTPEFTTEYANGGGLGNYLNRISKALRDQGHQPEIFVVSKETPGTFDFEGVLVHRVGYTERGLAIRVAKRVAYLARFYDWNPLVSLLRGHWLWPGVFAGASGKSRSTSSRVRITLRRACLCGGVNVPIWCDAALPANFTPKWIKTTRRIAGGPRDWR